jgi:hypothetical protein
MEMGQILSAALVAALVPLVLGWLASQRGGAAAGEIRHSTGFRVLAVALGTVPSLGFGLVFALQDRPLRPDELPALAMLLAFFPLIAAPLVLESFGVRHRYDDETLALRSPWRRARTLRWSNVQSIAWRKHLKWLDLRTIDGVAHVSPMLVGLDGFARTALERLDPTVLDRSPEAAAVLELMKHEAAGALLSSPLAPTALLAALRGDPAPR